MKQKKIYIISLLLYFITQLLSIFSGVFLLFYLAFFILSIVMGITWLRYDFDESRKLNVLSKIILWSFIVNLILTVIYLKVLYFNSEINWKIENGGYEQDPMIIMTYFPAVFFLISLTFFLISGLIIKLKSRKT